MYMESVRRVAGADDNLLSRFVERIRELYGQRLRERE
jgi:hypothetical protein